MNPDLRLAQELAVHLDGENQNEKAETLGYSASAFTKRMKRESYKLEWVRELIDASGRAVLLLPNGEYRVLHPDDLRRLGVI